jgi:hypothetical protein
MTRFAQVLHLLHNHLRPSPHLHRRNHLPNLPAAPPPLRGDGRRLHTVGVLAGRADCGVHRAMGSHRQRQLAVQSGSVQPEPDRPDASDARVAAAEEHMSELAGCVCAGAGGRDLLVVVDGYGLSGFCWG